MESEEVIARRTYSRRNSKQKILRQIFGPVRENGTWRRRYNFELYKLYNELDIVKFIKIRRLDWAWHVVRMQDDRVAKRVFKFIPMERRKVGRPRLRWEDCVMDDIKTLGVRNWRSLALDREEWRELLKKAGAHEGLSCH